MTVSIPDSPLMAVRQQLADDIDSHCRPMHFHTARCALLRISIEPLGYTFVAKGMEAHNLRYLRLERQIYRQLSPIQGRHVPVRLGITKLGTEYYYSGARLSHLLLMSWGGFPLSAPLNQPHRRHFRSLAEEALAAVHGAGVSHNDAESRNMLFNPKDGRFMVIDIERALPLRKGVGVTVSPEARSRRLIDRPAQELRSVFEKDLSRMRRCLAF